MNYLQLHFVHDPNRLIEKALTYSYKGDEFVFNMIAQAYLCWTFFFKTVDREAAAKKLLASLEKRGFNDWRDRVVSYQQKVASDNPDWSRN